jgi:hypothetical protein
MARSGLAALLVLGFALAAAATPRLGEDGPVARRDHSGDLLRIAQNADKPAASKNDPALRFDSIPAVEFEEKAAAKPRRRASGSNDAHGFPTTLPVLSYQTTPIKTDWGLRANDPYQRPGALPTPTLNRPHYGTLDDRAAGVDRGRNSVSGRCLRRVHFFAPQELGR